jgi:hypothetical protein
VHGGAASQVVAKACERLALAADRQAANLLGLADDPETENARLAATNSALDRAMHDARYSCATPVHLRHDAGWSIASCMAHGRLEKCAATHSPLAGQGPSDLWVMSYAWGREPDTAVPKKCCPQIIGQNPTARNRPQGLHPRPRVYRPAGHLVPTGL